MKTKELIRLLQEEDPSGEEEVCVGNVDIYFVNKEPAYYDGCLQVLKRDESKTDCYNVIGAEYRSKGAKIQLHCHSIEDAIWDDPDMEVTHDSDYTRTEYYISRVEKARKEAKDFEKELEAKRKK